MKKLSPVFKGKEREGERGSDRTEVRRNKQSIDAKDEPDVSNGERERERKKEREKEHSGCWWNVFVRDP